MSWPADGLPRFKPLVDQTNATSEIPGHALAVVLDRANCHRPVSVQRTSSKVGALLLAQSAAARLEAEHGAR